jgi:3-methyladenine DNA glycosylase AlkD
VEKLLFLKTDLAFMNDILFQLRRDLAASADPQTQKTFQRFFKEQVKYYGVKTPNVGKIAKNYWQQVKTRDKKDIFALCEELFRSDYTEEAFVVSFWLPNYVANLEPEDLATFKVWIECYINNWAKCDGFCNPQSATSSKNTRSS